MARARHVSVAPIALAWLLAQPAVSSISLGATKLHQLGDNLGAVSIEFIPPETAELNEIAAANLLYPHWFNENLLDAKPQTALGAIHASGEPLPWLE